MPISLAVIQQRGKWFLNRWLKLVFRKPITLPILGGPNRGLLMRLDISSQKSYFRGDTEPFLAKAMHALISDGDTVFDIGAHIGYFSMLLSKKVGSGQCFSFEMNDDIAQELEENLKRNKITNCQVVKQGVSRSSGRTRSLEGWSSSTGRLLKQREKGRERDDDISWIAAHPHQLKKVYESELTLLEIEEQLALRRQQKVSNNQFIKNQARENHQQGDTYQAILALRTARSHLGSVINHSNQIQEVSTTSLDDFIRNNPPVLPRFMKLDVEGAAGEVLEGSTMLFSAAKPILIVELHNLSEGKDVWQFLSERDYRCFSLSEDLRPIHSPLIPIIPGGTHLLALPQDSLFLLRLVQESLNN